MSRFFPRARAVLVLVLLGLCFTTAARAESRAECRSLPSKILASDVSYCAFLPPGYDADPSRKYPVLYFLHGLGEDAQILLNSGGWNLIQDVRRQQDIGDFVVVTPSAGRSFYINSRNGRVRYEDFFIKEFMPFIESRYRIQANRRNRGIMGISMGGYGALRLAFRFPDLFGSVSAHSAALIDKLPANAAQSDSPQAQNLARLVGTAFGVPFDRDFWARNNPFTLVRTGARPSNLAIYFDCGTEDQFGFDVGAQAFDKLLAAKRIPHEFHLYPGGHDWNYFAEHFPASLAFESRAFGLSPEPKGN
jgi:S-formylglutathione hydrolase FrmB